MTLILQCAFWFGIINLMDLLSFQIFVVKMSRFLLMDHVLSPELRPVRRKSSRPKYAPTPTSNVDMSKYTNVYDSGINKPQNPGPGDNKAKPKANLNKAQPASSSVPVPERHEPPLVTAPEVQPAVKPQGPSDWKILVAIVDRMLFIIYLTFMIVVLVLFFPRPD